MRIEIKLKNIILILLGGAIMGFSLEFFLVPAKIAAGGVSGIATVLYHLFDLPVGITVFVINIRSLSWVLWNSTDVSCSLR